LSTQERSAGSLFDAEDHLGLSRSFPRTTIQAVIGAIVRRMNIWSAVRLTGVPQHQVKAIVVHVGNACARYHQKCLSGMRCGDLRCSLKMVLQEKHRGPLLNRRHLLAVGSAWAWTSIDPKSGCVPTWFVEPRNAEIARGFLTELATLRPGRIQIACRRLTRNPKRSINWAVWCESRLIGKPVKIRCGPATVSAESSRAKDATGG
jgi:hypothetical protein